MQVHGNGPVLDDEILQDVEVQDAIKNEGSVHRKYKIVNTDRATFGRVGGAVAKLHGDGGFAGTLSFDLEVSSQCPVNLQDLAAAAACWALIEHHSCARSCSMPNLLSFVKPTHLNASSGPIVLLSKE